MKNIICQDCSGSGLVSGECDNRYCDDPKSCSFSVPDFNCLTCVGKGEVNPDICNRYWAEKYRSKETKLIEKLKKTNKKELKKKDDILYCKEEIKRLKKELQKTENKLNKLLNI